MDKITFRNSFYKLFWYSTKLIYNLTKLLDLNVYFLCLLWGQISRFVIQYKSKYNISFLKNIRSFLKRLERSLI